MYSQDKIDIALQVYHQCGYVTNTIRMLGYPTRRALYTWIENEGVQKPPRKALDNTNTAARGGGAGGGGGRAAKHTSGGGGGSLRKMK